MTNHGCQFAWCTNEMGSHPTHMLEHFAEYKSFTATGSSPAARDTETLPIIMVGTRFNEDIEAAPTISVGITGGQPYVDTDVDLRADEAILLYNALGAAIQNAIQGTKIDPARVTSFYKESR